MPVEDVDAKEVGQLITVNLDHGISLLVCRRGFLDQLVRQLMCGAGDFFL
jgi:hypothetical protein